MRSTWRTARAALIVVGVAATIVSSKVEAQTPLTGEGRSLGGYGGSMTDAGAGVGGPVIPYAGKFGGFMPYRMGGSGTLSFQSRGNSPMGSGRTSFSLSPMSGGMSSMSGGFGSGSRTLSPIGAQGAMGLGGGSGLGGGMNQMSGTRGTGVMPPSFGYPFRQPPSLVSPASSGAGMSM